MIRLPFFTRRKPAAAPAPSLRAQARRIAQRALVHRNVDQMRAKLGLPAIDWENL